MASPPGPPEGCWQDAAGRFVPEHLVKPEHKLEDELVRRLHERARAAQQALADLKADAFEDVDALVDLLAESYSAQRAGAKGNLTLSSYDGSLRVQVAVGEQIEFGPELQVAKSLVDDCIKAWSAGADDNLLALVRDAFDVDRKGALRVDRILGLRRLAITDPTWLRAMDAIGNAVRTQESKRYVRFYTRPAPEQPHRLLPLDLSHA